MPVNWNTKKHKQKQPTTLWHQPDVMTQQRLQLRGAGKHLCICKSQATNHWINSDLWLCDQCSSRYAKGENLFLT